MCGSCGCHEQTYPCCQWPQPCGCGCHEPMPLMSRLGFEELLEESRCGCNSGCGCGGHSGCGCG